MLVARRVYLYLITFISLLILLSGVSTLLRLLFEQALSVAPDTFAGPDYLREQFSSAAALTLVGVVVWAIHWLLAQRSVAAPPPAGDQERRSVLRKLLIYGVLLVTVAEVLFALSRLLQALLLVGAAQGATDLRAVISEAVPTIAVYGLGWAYYARIRATDAAVAPEGRRGHRAPLVRLSGQLRRALRAHVRALVAGPLSLADRHERGCGGLYRWGRRAATRGERRWLDRRLRRGWLGHWSMAQQTVVASPGEQRARLRQVYLFAMIFQTVAVTLTKRGPFHLQPATLPAGQRSCGRLRGVPANAAGGPLLTAIVYGVFWAYHRWVLRGDAALATDDPARQTSLQRLYLHLVALIGLAVLATGVASLLRLLIDLGLGGATTTLSRAGWADQISFFATSILVGLPAWYLTWAPLQRRAWSPEASEDRQALVRRVYLYLILFAAVIALLGSAGTLIYQFVRHVGGVFDAGALGAISWALGAALTAGVLLVYHLRVLLADQRAAALPAPAEALPLTEPAAPGAALLLIHNAGADSLMAAAAAARDALPTTAVAEVIATPGLTAADLRAWLDSRAVAAPPAPAAPTPGPPAAAGPAPAPDPGLI